MSMKRFMMSVPDKMYSALETEAQLRHMNSIQETLRQIVSEYLRDGK